MPQGAVLQLALEGGAGLVGVRFPAQQTIHAVTKVMEFAEFTDSHFRFLFLKLQDSTELITKVCFSAKGSTRHTQSCQHPIKQQLGTNAPNCCLTSHSIFPLSYWYWNKGKYQEDPMTSRY